MSLDADFASLSFMNEAKPWAQGGQKLCVDVAACAMSDAGFPLITPKSGSYRFDEDNVNLASPFRQGSSSGTAAHDESVLLPEWLDDVNVVASSSPRGTPRKLEFDSETPRLSFSVGPVSDGSQSVIHHHTAGPLENILSAESLVAGGDLGYASPRPLRVNSSACEVNLLVSCQSCGKHFLGEKYMSGHYCPAISKRDGNSSNQHFDAKDAASVGERGNRCLSRHIESDRAEPEQYQREIDQYRDVNDQFREVNDHNHDRKRRHGSLLTRLDSCPEDATLTSRSSDTETDQEVTEFLRRLRLRGTATAEMPQPRQASSSSSTEETCPTQDATNTDSQGQLASLTASSTSSAGLAERQAIWHKRRAYTRSSMASVLRLSLVGSRSGSSGRVVIESQSIDSKANCTDSGNMSMGSENTGDPFPRTGNDDQARCKYGFHISAHQNKYTTPVGDFSHHMSLLDAGVPRSGSRSLSCHECEHCHRKFSEKRTAERHARVCSSVFGRRAENLRDQQRQRAPRIMTGFKRASEPLSLQVNLPVRRDLAKNGLVQEDDLTMDLRDGYMHRQTKKESSLASTKGLLQSTAPVRSRDSVSKARDSTASLQLVSADFKSRPLDGSESQSASGVLISRVGIPVGSQVLDLDTAPEHPADVSFTKTRPSVNASMEIRKSSEIGGSSEIRRSLNHRREQTANLLESRARVSRPEFEVTELEKSLVSDCLVSQYLTNDFLRHINSSRFSSASTTWSLESAARHPDEVDSSMTGNHAYNPAKYSKNGLSSQSVSMKLERATQPAFVAMSVAESRCSVETECSALINEIKSCTSRLRERIAVNTRDA